MANKDKKQSDTFQHALGAHMLNATPRRRKSDNIKPPSLLWALLAGLVLMALPWIIIWVST